MEAPFDCNGEALQLWKYENSADQKWLKRQMENGAFSIQNYKDGRVVDVDYWKLEERNEVNTNIQFLDSKGQVWKFV